MRWLWFFWNEGGVVCSSRRRRRRRKANDDEKVFSSDTLILIDSNCNCSHPITEFCKSIGADAKQRQGLIRLAKKNGEKLGFLA